MRVSGDKKTSPPGKSINNQMVRRKSSRLRLNNPYDEITIARSRRMGDDDDGDCCDTAAANGLDDPDDDDEMPLDLG